jgi:hypothetical protein
MIYKIIEKRIPEGLEVEDCAECNMIYVEIFIEADSFTELDTILTENDINPEKLAQIEVLTQNIEFILK